MSIAAAWRRIARTRHGLSIARSASRFGFSRLRPVRLLEPLARRRCTNAPTVLFLCPHGAGKSVLASVQFQRLAKERGLNVRVESAGAEPDPTVAPVVADHLRQNGDEVPVSALGR